MEAVPTERHEGILSTGDTRSLRHRGAHFLKRGDTGDKGRMWRTGELWY